MAVHEMPRSLGSFRVEMQCRCEIPQENLALALSGSIPHLGNWNLKDALVAEEVPIHSGRWVVGVRLPAGLHFEYKWVIVWRDSLTPFMWEDGANRSTHVEGSGRYLCAWNMGGVFQPITGNSGARRMHPLLSPLSVCTRVKGLVRSPCLRSFHAASSNITYPVKLCVIPQDCRRKLPWSQNYETNINRSISSQSIRDSMSNLVKEYFGPETLFVNSAMKSLMYCHDLTGLPWWTTICVVTVGLKTLLVFPLSVHGRKVNAKLVLMNEKMLKILPELEREVHIEAVRKGWTQEEAKMVFHVNKKKIVREHYIKENCHPMKGFASLLTQLPLWLSVSFALRHLSGSFYWASKTEASKYVAIDMQNEGVLWFTSLFQPDPFYILPVILLSTNLAIGVINLYELRKMKRGNLAKILTGMMMFYSVAIFSISILMPSCITFYWSTSAICSLVQLLLLNNLKVQKALGIPDVRHLMLKKINDKEQLNQRQ